MKNKDILFFILLSCVFLWGIFTYLKDTTLESMAENRSLNTFQIFTFNKFLTGEFQDKFESALSDQFAGSEQIRVFYKKALNSLPTFGAHESLCKGRYLKLQETDQERIRGLFNCEDYIIYLPSVLSEETRNIINDNIKKYNHLNEISDVYYYFVEDTSTIDFSKNNLRVNDYYGKLKKELKGEKGLKRLEWDTFDDYKRFFYKTDHHWNYIGSYQGYLDIMEMLGEKNIVEPKEIFTNHEDYYGSFARNTNNYDYHEEFTYYRFDLPEHSSAINRKVQKYNHYEEYENHDYQYGQSVNYYAYVYGDDYGEIVFDYNQPKKENLLIIGNSDSNPINELIASSFNKTYVVDLRHYKNSIGENFIPRDYIKNNKIDKVLVLMSPTFISLSESNRGLEL